MPEKVKATQPCLTLYNPMDYTVHGIFQARIQKWVAFPFSTQGSNPHLLHYMQIVCHLGSIKYVHNAVKLLFRTFSTCKYESLSPYPLITTVLLSVSMNLFSAFFPKYSFLNPLSCFCAIWANHAFKEKRTIHNFHRGFVK